LLNRLVEHGLLERRHDPRDRRANRLFLTASGRQLVDDLDSLRDAIAADALRDIPAASIETTLETLRDIKDRIKDLAEPGTIAARERPANSLDRKPQVVAGRLHPVREHLPLQVRTTPGFDLEQFQAAI